MKKRSGTKAGASEPPEPVFFTDRDLGKRFPAILRQAGLRVEAYAEHFGEAPIDDASWLTEVGRRGWVVISHDRSQLLNRDERDAAMRARVRAFYVVGSAPFPELAAAFVDAIEEIRHILHRRQEPFLAKVYRATPAQRHRVRIAVTLAQWVRRRR